MQESRDFKGVWIPREIWLNPNLNALEKIIYAEIDSLSGCKLKCIKSNASLAEFCQCSESKVSKAISKLIDLGLVEQVSFDGRKRVLQGRLSYFTMQDSKNYEADKHNMLHSNIDSNTINSTYINNDSYHDSSNDFSSNEHEEVNPSPNADKNITSDSFYKRVLDKESVFIDGIDVSYAFRTIWDEYPKKSGKKAACNAYLKFVRSNPKEKIVELIINLDTYKKVCTDRGTEEQYIKMMQGFINDKQFDEYSKYNCDVYNENSKKYYETKEEYVEAIKNGEIEMYSLPRYMITF